MKNLRRLRFYSQKRRVSFLEKRLQSRSIRSLEGRVHFGKLFKTTLCWNFPQLCVCKTTLPFLFWLLSTRSNYFGASRGNTKHPISLPTFCKWKTFKGVILAFWRKAFIIIFSVFRRRGSSGQIDAFETQLSCEGFVHQHKLSSFAGFAFKKFFCSQLTSSCLMMASVVKTGVCLNRKAKFNNRLCCRHFKFGETIEWPIVESSLTLCLRRSLKHLNALIWKGTFGNKDFQKRKLTLLGVVWW